MQHEIDQSNTSDIPTKRKCISCGKIKPLGEFYMQNTKKGERKTICKDCQNKYYKEYWRKKKEGKPIRKRRPKFPPVSDDELIEEYKSFSKKYGYEYGATAKVLIEQEEIHPYSLFVKRFKGLGQLREIAFKDKLSIEIEKYRGSFGDWKYYVNVLYLLAKASGVKIGKLNAIFRNDHIPQLNTMVNITNEIGLDFEIKSIRTNDILTPKGVEDWTYYIKVLKKIYEENNLIQSEMSKRTGVSQQQIARLFNCTSIPKLDTFLKVANALGAYIEFQKKDSTHNV